MQSRKKVVALAALFATSELLANSQPIEELLVSSPLFKDTTQVSPTSKITLDELSAINLITTEDAVAYEPSLVIRRRFIGDPNGTMGIRSSGMFQTARSLVFADGLPLHYLLQTRWSGSSRWSLIAPNEMASAEVIYGPYSAEYSGNAMGGVVKMTTRVPDQQRITLQGNAFSQQYDQLATDQSYNGGKLFASYEDRIGKATVFASYNYLKNRSQPMTNYTIDAADQASLEAAGISGAIAGKDEMGNDVLYVGDSGGETAISQLYKLKLTYDIGDIRLRGTVAYEDRQRREDDKNNYLRDIGGNSYWQAGNRNFDERKQDRESLLLGLGLSGQLNHNWQYDIYATDFDILNDEETRSGLHPDDPAFGSTVGRLTEHGDTGWQTLDIKVGTESLFNNDDMRLSVGYYADHYQLEINSSNIDAISGGFISSRDGSGGETSTQALFAQWGLALTPQWDLALGMRYEDWQSKGGYLGDEQYQDRDDNGISPKLSLAFTPNDRFSVRYSLAKAYRFPIVEELYSNESSTTNLVVSDPSLKPEEGLHHNLTFNQAIERGFVRLNLFYETVDNTIYNQSGTLIDNGANVSLSTFLAIDEVEAAGIEFIVNQQQVLGSHFNLRFNVTYTDAEITKNTVNPAIEGKDVPRIADWRANLILSYPVSHSIDVSSSIRYASDSFGRLDNSDTVQEVYGAIDDYLFVNAKANWQLSEQASIAVGIDNLFDELAYVAHPWPSRTLFLEGKISF
jgi:iron complex outermembrane receptor protein